MKKIYDHAERTMEGLADLCIVAMDNGPIGVVEYIGQGYADMAQTPEGVSSITGEVASLIVLKFAGKMLNTNVSPKKAEVKPVEGGTEILQTGGRQIDYNAYIKRLETIDAEYQNIRIDTTDISRIAQNTGIPEWKIRRIKEHIFFNEHILDSGIKRFDADPEIVDAWYRLINGSYNQNDIDLLNHEYYESKFMGFYKTDYRTAHNKTEESGRIWDHIRRIINGSIC